MCIRDSPSVAGLAVDTTYMFTISTVNNVFGCNDPSAQSSLTGSVTISPEPSISLTPGGSDNLIICQGETISSTLGGVDIEWDITGYATGASIDPTQLPAGVQQSYISLPQIMEIIFAGNPANIDNGDIYSITVNGVPNSVTVGVGLNTFDSVSYTHLTLPTTERV